ncbi:MAG: NTP transferase domain-containing protein [Candidatus Omnitrophica bacterium]|nr:NTP transferase domain-containing protein [Candidatus Omnitrophota bacterium]
MRIVGEIPAREGSKRVPRKNLRPLDGKPLIRYAIEAARGAKRLSEVYVNTDSDEIARIASESGVKVYRRPLHLGSDSATQDQFNADFIQAIKPDLLVMVNPVAPLVESRDIDRMVEFLLERELDTLVTVKEERLHSLCQGKPINFSLEEQLRRTQDLDPVQLCSWAVAVWRASAFLKSYQSRGHAAFSGQVGFYPLSGFKSVKISTEEDFILAEILVRNMHRWKFPPVPYDSEKVDPRYPSMWMTEIRAIEGLLEEQARENRFLNILEWGGGRSTIYFSQLLKERGIPFRWIAMENFIPWHQQVVRMIQEEGLAETTSCVLRNGTCEERKYIQETMDLADYIQYPATLRIQFHLILVDGRRRRECLERARDLLAPSGVVVLHDAERPDYHGPFSLYDGGGRFVCENASPVPGGMQRLWVGRQQGGVVA